MVIPRPYLRFLPVASIGVVSLLAIGVVLLVKDMLQKSPPPKPRMQMVTLFVPPPPRFEKPPEPEIQKQDVKMQDVVEQTPEAPPPGNDLGVDADGNGADSFGLKARKGGRGLLDGGPFGWYAARLDADIQEHIADDKKLRRQLQATEPR